MQLQISVKFEPRDVWVGVYVAKMEPQIPWVTRVYVCIVPMFPIIFAWPASVRM